MNTNTKRGLAVGSSLAVIGAIVLGSWVVASAEPTPVESPSISTVELAPSTPTPTETAPAEPVVTPAPEPAPVAPEPAPAPATEPAPEPAPAPPTTCPAGTVANAVDEYGNESNCQPLNNEGEQCNEYNAANECVSWYKP